MFRRNIVESWELMRVTNTWKSLDASLSVLNPEGNFFELIGIYFRKSADRQFKELRKAGLRRGADPISLRRNQRAG